MKQKTKAIVMQAGAAVFTIAAFLFFGFLSIFIPAYTPAFYKAQFEKHGTLEAVQYQARYLDDPDSEDYDPAAAEYVRNMTDEQLMDLMMHAMRYCSLLEDDLNITVDGQYLKIFRKDEVSHMKDVRGVFAGGIVIVLVSVVLGVAYLIFALRNRKLYCEKARKIPYFTLIALASVLAFVGICAAIDFDAAFDIFHRIFFEDNWVFGSGVMVYMIGPIFTDLVPVIIVTWVALTALFVTGLIFYNRRLKCKYATSTASPSENKEE